MGDQVTLHEIISDGIAVADPRHESHNYSERARRNLWLQMSRMGAYSDTNEVPIMVRGEGTRVYDANGTEYFDGLSGLFTNMLGHGRADIGATVPEHVGEESRQAVEVLGAVGVIDARPLAAHHDRHLVGVRVRAHARHLQPEVASCALRVVMTFVSWIGNGNTVGDDLVQCHLVPHA